MAFKGPKQSVQKTGDGVFELCSRTRLGLKPGSAFIVSKQCKSQMISLERPEVMSSSTSPGLEATSASMSSRDPK